MRLLMQLVNVTLPTSIRSELAHLDKAPSSRQPNQRLVESKSGMLQRTNLDGLIPSRVPSLSSNKTVTVKCPLPERLPIVKCDYLDTYIYILEYAQVTEMYKVTEDIL